MGKYDRPSLIEFCDNNAAVLDVIPDKCTRETRVSGACLTGGCDDCFEKTIRVLFENGGPFCTTCSKINRVKKMLTTQNIEIKTEPVIYDYKLLQSLDIKNEDYVGTLNRDTPIRGDCQKENCCNQFLKPFREVLNNGGPFCTTCSKINRVKKMLTTQNIEIKTEPVIYDYKLLQSLDIKNEDYVGTLNRDTPIRGDCQKENCCNQFLKPFREVLNNGGPFCTTCSKINRVKKMLTTQNIEIKTEPVIYDYKLLERIKKTRKLDIDLSVYKDKYLSRESLIKGWCIIPNCPDMFEKNFRSLYKNDVPCCETCTKINRVKKMLTTQNIEIKTEPVIYDYKLLERIIKTRKLHINLSRYKGKYLSRESLIKGMCIIPNCPDMFEKNFRSLYKNDVPCCKICTKRVIMSRSKKARFKKKEFKTPGGQTWYLQGYEPLVAPELIKEYGEENIIAAIDGDRCVPAIPWFDEDGGEHHYFCDFFIPNLNLIIEVKSTWTEEQNDDKIKRTRKASNELGYDFRLIVLNKAGEWVEDVTSANLYQQCSTSSP